MTTTSPPESREQTLTDARARCAAAIAEGFAADEPVLIDALPAMGKSYGVIEWAAQTGNPLTVFTERHDLYDQYETWCTDREEPLSYFRIPSFHRDCPTAREEPAYDPEWQRRFHEKYDAGYSAKYIHEHAQTLFGRSLPCQTHGECLYLRRLREFQQITEGERTPPDVIVGHFTHSLNPSYSKDRYVAYDEYPEDSFLRAFPKSPGAISTFFKQNGELPFLDWADFSENRTRHTTAEIKSWLRRFFQKDWRERWRKQLALLDEGKTPDAFYAPYLVDAELSWQPLANRWAHAQLRDGVKAVKDPHDGKITLFIPPRIEDAKSVIALDGTPTVEAWQLVLGDQLDHLPVLTDGEKYTYLQEGLGLRLIQTTDHAKHYSGREAKNVTPHADLALLEAIKRREGQMPMLITSRAALTTYRAHGLDELLDGHTKRLLAPDDPDDDLRIYYGNLKGLNTLGTLRRGIVIGSPHFGDEELKKRAAFHGHSLTPGEDAAGTRLMGMAADYGEFGNRLLRGMREYGLVQAVMRFGRTESDTGRGATVYVHTAALPEWVPRERQIADIKHWWGPKQGRRRVVETIRTHLAWETGEWSVQDVYEHINDGLSSADEMRLSEEQTRKHLKGLHKLGLLCGEQGGEGRRWNEWRWWNNHLEDAGAFGWVQFTAESATAQASNGSEQ